MYTEMNEVVQYIGYRMADRVPYHKMCLFGEHLANLMLLHYHAGWDATDPNKNSESRVLLIVTRTNYQQTANDLVLSATNSAGLGLDEVLFCLPETIEFRINPGRVMVREMTTGYLPIWVGPLNADENYRMGPLLNLSLRSPEELDVDNPTHNSKFRMFRAWCCWLNAKEFFPTADKLAKDVKKQASKREQYHRRRMFDPEAPIDYINERNRRFNSKLDRFYSKYTGDIKDDLDVVMRPGETSALPVAPSC